MNYSLRTMTTALFLLVGSLVPITSQAVESVPNTALVTILRSSSNT